MVSGAHRTVTVGWVRVYRWVGLAGEFGPDLGADSGMEELLFLLEESLLFLFGPFLMHALPLPLVDAAGEGPGAAAHGPGEDESAEELR